MKLLSIYTTYLETEKGTPFVLSVRAIISKPPPPGARGHNNKNNNKFIQYYHFVQVLLDCSQSSIFP